MKKYIPFTVILASVKMKREQVQTLNTYLTNNIELTDIQAQYDENAKALIADKQVLARIAKYRTTEFKDYDIPTIIICIEDEPEISKIPVFPGMRNTASESITGMNNESTITFPYLSSGFLPQKRKTVNTSWFICWTHSFQMN